MEVIAISGTPGTGKTVLAKKIAQESGYRYIDVNEVIRDNNLAEGYDKELDTNIVDTEKLNRVLAKLIKGSKERGLVIDSHLSHYLPPEYVTRCIVTKCQLSTLRKRLEKRGYSEKKIRDNLDAEIFDTCRIEALEAGHNVETVFTD